MLNYKFGIQQDNKDLELLRIHTIKVYFLINLGAHAVILVYDITNPESFASI
jgi:hypothetical protein